MAGPPGHLHLSGVKTDQRLPIHNMVTIPHATRVILRDRVQFA
jgi:hypothetical protein